MSATATPPRAGRAARLAAAVRRRPLAATVAGLALLGLASLLLRSQALDAKLWIDEGLSIGIASHGLTEIPGLLRQDGAPPLYYLILHVWIEVVGDGESRTHALSLLFALATIPVAFWAGRALFGTRAGWACAALAAFNPYLTYYAQETRMYSLVVLLSLAACATFALGFAQRRRGAIPGFAVVGALLVYTHNWGLFLLAGCALALAAIAWRSAPDERRALSRDGVLAFGAIALLYAPWVPTLVGQAMDTAAPWAERPGIEVLDNAFTGVLGGAAAAILAGFVGVAGLVELANRRGRRDPLTRAALALGAVTAAGVLLAFLASQASPAWATRYLAVFVGPLLLLLGAGLTAYGRAGLIALGIVLLLWTDGRERELRAKGNPFAVAFRLDELGYASPGDLVLATHPEQVPVMRYYMGDGYRWADALGPVEDPLVFDWRDALDRLEERGPIRVSREVLRGLTPGQDVLLIQPIIRSGRWGAPWTRLVRRRAAQWERTLNRTDGLRRIAVVPRLGNRRPPRGVRAVVYRRTVDPLRLPEPGPPADG